MVVVFEVMIPSVLAKIPSGGCWGSIGKLSREVSLDWLCQEGVSLYTQELWYISAFFSDELLNKVHSGKCPLQSKWTHMATIAKPNRRYRVQRITNVPSSLVDMSIMPIVHRIEKAKKKLSTNVQSWW